MQKYEYTIQLDLSDDKIRSQFQSLLGDFNKQVKKNAIQIQLDWDPKSVKDLIGRADEIAKQFPEIGIQFKYEVNKKLLADLQESYNTTWLYDDTERAAQRIRDLFKEYQNLTKQYKGVAPELIPKETIDRLEYLKDELGTMQVTLTNMQKGDNPHAKNGPAVFQNLKKELTGLEELLEKINAEVDKAGDEYESYPLINKASVKEYDAQKEYLKSLKENIVAVQKSMKSLEKQGAVDLTSKIDQATKDSKVKEEIEAIKQALADLREKAGQNISLKVQIKDAVDSINVVKGMLDDLVKPKLIPIQLDGVKEFQDAAETAKKNIEAVLGQIRVGFSGGSINRTGATKTNKVVEGAVLTEQQTETKIVRLTNLLKDLKEQESRLAEPNYGEAQKKVDYYNRVSESLNIEKKTTKELTKAIEEQAEAYKKVAAARKSKKEIEHIDKDGNSIIGIPSLEAVNAYKDKLAGLLGELRLALKGKDKDPFASLGKMSQRDLTSIKNLSNTYTDGLAKIKAEQKAVEDKNINIKSSINGIRKEIEDIVKLFTGTSINKKGLYEVLDKFQSGNLSLPKTIDALKELMNLTSATNATTSPETVVKNTTGFFAQLQKELEEEVQKQNQVKQAAVEAGDATSEALEKTAEKGKKAKYSIEELTEMIRELAQEAAAVGALNSPLGGYGGKAKGAWKRLSEIASNPDSKNYAAAKEIIENNKLFTETGDVDLLNAIKARSKELTGDAEKVQAWIEQAVDGYIRKLSRNITGAVKKAVETEIQIMNKTKFKEWYRGQYAKKGGDLEVFEHNFERELARKVKVGEATQSKTSTGKPGIWQIEVEVPVDKLKKQFEELKAITKEFGNFNLNKKGDREGIASIIEKFRAYQSAGGKSTLEDLTGNSKALAKLTAEYEKQTEAAKANAEAKKENAKITDNATSKKAEEQAKDLTQSYKGLDDELQKLLADLPKLVTLFSGLINGTQNSVKVQDNVQKELKETSESATVAAKSVADLNKEFKILKENKSVYDKETLVGEYISYQQAGGTKKISELATRQVNTKALEAEYKKQMAALAQNNTVLNNMPSAKIPVEPIVLDPQQFADKVTALIAKVFATINVIPNIDISKAIIKKVEEPIKAETQNTNEINDDINKVIDASDKFGKKTQSVKKQVEDANKDIVDSYEHLGLATTRVLNEIGLSYEEYIKKINSQTRDINFGERLGFVNDKGQISESIKGTQLWTGWEGQIDDAIERIIHLHPYGKGEAEVFSPEDILEYYVQALTKGLTPVFELWQNQQQTILDFNGVDKKNIPYVVTALQNVFSVVEQNLKENGGTIESRYEDAYQQLYNSLIAKIMDKYGGVFKTEKDYALPKKSKIDLEENFAILEKYTQYLRGDVDKGGKNFNNPDDWSSIQVLIESFKQLRQGVSQIEKPLEDASGKFSEVKKKAEEAGVSIESLSKIALNYRRGLINDKQFEASIKSINRGNIEDRIKNGNGVKYNFTTDDALIASKYVTGKELELYELEKELKRIDECAQSAGSSLKEMAEVYSKYLSGDIGLKDVQKYLSDLQNNQSGYFDFTMESMVKAFRKYQSEIGSASKETLQVIDKSLPISNTTQEIESAVKAESELKSAIIDTTTKIEQQGKVFDFNPQEFVNQISQALKGFYVKVGVQPEVNLEVFNQALSTQLQGTNGLESLNKLINNLAKNKDGRIDGVVQSLNNIREALNKNLGKNSLGQALKEIASQADGLKALSSIIKDYEKAVEIIQQAKANTPFDEDEKALLRANDQAEEYVKNEKLIAEERAKGNEQAEKYAKERQKEAQEYEKWWLQALATVEKAQAKKLDTDTKSVQKIIDDLKVNGNINILGDSFNQQFSQLQKKFAQFKVDVQRLSATEAQKELDKLVSEAKKLKKAAADIKKEINSVAPTPQIDALKTKIESILTYKKKLTEDSKTQLNSMLDRLTPGMSKQELSELNREFSTLLDKMKMSGELGTTFGQRWRRGLQSLSRYLLTFASFYRIVGYIRQAFTTIKELDDALIDLRKTTTMTNEQLEEFYHNSANVGKVVGTTAKEIISQAAAWSRLGYQTKEEATAMAELSAQFAAISPGMDLDKATDGLVSTMKAFHVDVENVEQEVMDSINRVGNTMATSNEEVVEMLTRSSAAMSAANNTLAETIALESAAVQITRNAETTGTAFRTISMRIRGKLSMPPYVERRMLCYAM